MEDVIENRNISCGLCKAKVVTSEWDNHVRDHCFIAWEEGQKFVSEFGHDSGICLRVYSLQYFKLCIFSFPGFQ